MNANVNKLGFERKIYGIEATFQSKLVNIRPAVASRALIID